MMSVRSMAGRGLAAIALAVALGCEPGSLGSGDRGGAASADKPRPPGAVSVEEGEAKRVYYQYVDARGRVQFVPTLDAVPAEWREKVGFVEMAGPPPGSPAEARRIRDRRTASIRVPAAEPTASASSGSGSSAQVIMYTADWCGVCTRAKRYMDQQGIAYDARDVDDPQWKQEMVAKAGAGGIPVFDVDGEILRGFSPQGLQNLLKS
jgi:mycoredoxin